VGLSITKVANRDFAIRFLEILTSRRYIEGAMSRYATNWRSQELYGFTICSSFPWRYAEFGENLRVFICAIGEEAVVEAIR